MEAIQAELTALVIAILTALVGLITEKVVTVLKEKGVLARLESNRELVRLVVESVEQAYKHLNGPEKFNVAKIEVVNLMQEKKIHISEREIDVLIEAMVKEMNLTFQKITKD